MHRRTFEVLTVVAVAAGVAVAGCGRRVRYYESPPIDGLRFGAFSELTGARRDTLLLRIWARNTARQERTVESGVCGDQLSLHVMPAGGPARGRAVWDSDARTRAGAAARAARDSASGRPGLGEVCVAIAVTQTFAPGDAMQVTAFAIPVGDVLGDSLPPGRYRFTVRARGSSAAAAGDLPAGEVELRTPPA